jgi:hypothetical protein
MKYNTFNVVYLCQQPTSLLSVVSLLLIRTVNNILYLQYISISSKKAFLNFVYFKLEFLS